jgi:putative alpha-1,2-mannosidase
MSSWYVWAALGLYPVTPGRGELELGSPLFPHETVMLGDGRTIVIEAPGASPATPYVRGLEAGGLAGAADQCMASVPAATPFSGSTSARPAPVPYSCPWLPATVSDTGAQLDFTVSRTPDTTWGAGPTEAPPSFPAP